MRPRSFLFLLALVARPVVSQPYFVYPPAFVSTTDFSQNIVMVEGDYKVVQWANVSNPNNYRISVTMFQLNGTQFLPGAEYVIQNAPSDTLSTPWTVNTAKNLTVSPMFYLNLFFEGETTSLTNSHYFNITAASTTSSTSSSSTSSSTSSSISSQTSSGAKTSTTGSPVTTSSPPATSSPVVVASSGLSSGAKAGIAVGVIGAALLGVLAGWLILGRMMKRKNTEPPAPAHPPVQTSYYDPVKMEMQPQQYQQYPPAEVSGEPIPPMRYELSPDVRYELPPGVRQQP